MTRTGPENPGKQDARHSKTLKELSAEAAELLLDRLSVSGKRYAMAFSHQMRLK